MDEKQIPVIKRSLFSWVLAGNLKLQILLVVVIIVTVFARVLPLEMQKRVINDAIHLKKTDMLIIYCSIYVVSVISASGLKYLVNVLQTTIGQRSLADMRKALYHHIIALPLSFFRKTQPGVVVNALLSELSVAGDFVGMAVAVPVTSLLTLIAFSVYLFWLNPLLAGISLSIYPLVMLLLPRLQKRANIVNKKRVDTTRDLSDKIVESVSGIHEIQGNSSYTIERRKHDQFVEKLLRIRIVWNLYRYGIKVSNNFFTNLSPFLVFFIGGWLAIHGRLQLGALVAFLSAQEKLYDPWKELIEFYQTYQDASVRYTRTMEFFDAMPEHAIELEGRRPYELQGALEVKNLSFETENGIKLLDNISFSLNPGEQLALVGFSGSGKSTLALCIGQLNKYSQGHVMIDGREVAELTKIDMAQNMGFVSQTPFIFSGTIEENLLYSCVAKIEGYPADEKSIMPTLDDMIEVLQQTGLFADVLRFGLDAIISRKQDEKLVAALICVRESFQQHFGEILSGYVEFFNENEYLYHFSIAENLIFGAPRQEAFSDSNLFQNEYFLKFLNQADLTRPLLNLGGDLARQTVDILGNLPLEDIFFEQSPIKPDELDDYKTLVQRMKKKRLHQLEDRERRKILKLALRFSPGRHKMIPMPQMLENLILEGRSLFKHKISIDYPEAFAFYQMSDYIDSQTILNNILFGKLKTANPVAREKITQSIIQLLIEENLLETIIALGMQYQVGSKGDKLSGGQRQKLAIARVFLKAPKILIMDEATSALDNKSQTRIQNLLEDRWKGRSTLIAVAHRLDTIKTYDKVAVMKAGKIVEMGTYDELMARKGALHELVVGRK